MDKSFPLNGQQIPWSFFHKVRVKYGLRKAQEVFFQCRLKTNIRNYISKGMKEEWFARDIYRSPVLEAFILQHFDKRIPPEPKRKGSQKVDSISSVLGDITNGSI